MNSTAVSTEIEIDEKKLKKLKRNAYVLFERSENFRDAIKEEAFFIDYYNEAKFQDMANDTNDTHAEGIIEVLKERYRAAHELEIILEKKGRLRQLKREKENNGSQLTPVQESRLAEFSEDVGIFSSALSALPPIGVTKSEWEGKRASGRQKIQLEQELIRAKWLMDENLGELNDYEKSLGLSVSSISSLEAEKDTFLRRGGRNQLPEKVSYVENIDRNLRRAKEEHERTMARPESEFEPKKFGKNPLPKKDRLIEQEKEIDQLTKQLKKAESNLEGSDLLERNKKVVERARRSAKDNNDMQTYENKSEVYSKLKAIETGVDDIRNSGGSNADVINFVKIALSKMVNLDAKSLSDYESFIDIEAIDTNNDDITSETVEDEDTEDFDILMDNVLASYKK